MSLFIGAAVIPFRHAGVSYRRGERASSPGPHRFKPGAMSGFFFRSAMRHLGSRLQPIASRVRTLARTTATPFGVKRIRGSQLQRIRREHFQRHPLCVHCDRKGIVRAATELDHVIALENGGIDSPDPFVNRQGLCADCHAKKTERDNAVAAGRA